MGTSSESERELPLWAFRIVRDVAIEHNCTVRDILGSSRTAPVVIARAACIAALKAERPKYSMARIGAIVGRSYSTVSHALGRTAAAKRRGGGTGIPYANLSLFSTSKPGVRRRPPKIPDDVARAALERLRQGGVSTSALARELGVARTTVYRFRTGERRDATGARL